jgi:pimeloyl-ACP methyl ester carboxylesterase
MSRATAVHGTFEHGMIVRRVGTGPDVIWIHGLGEYAASFEACAKHPKLAGFTHVMPDLPGYGRSGRFETHGLGPLETIAAFLVPWIASHAPRPILIGHSMGGVLATMIAERMPIGAVVNIDGNLTRGDCTFSAEAAAYSREEFVATGLATMRAKVGERGASEPALAGYHTALGLADADVFHRNAIDLVRLSETETLAPRFAALTTRTLFVAGVSGGICERSRAQLDEHKIRWVGIEPAGHWPFVDQPEAFVNAVGPFLREI